MRIYRHHGPNPKLRNGTPAEKAKLRARLADGAMKARLKRSGLWDSGAAMKSSLKVYRAGEQPAN